MAEIADWEKILFKQGCLVSGAQKPLILHRPFPIDYVQNGVLIGPIYRIPLHKKYVEIGGDNPFNMHTWPLRFEIEFGTVKKLFFKMCGDLIEQGIVLPFAETEIKAIIKASHHAN
jgi:hypothetical protein